MIAVNQFPSLVVTTVSVTRNIEVLVVLCTKATERTLINCSTFVKCEKDFSLLLPPQLFVLTERTELVHSF